MFRFFEIVEIQGENESATEKIMSDSTEISESINDTKTEYASVEDPLSMYRTASNETILISEIPNIMREMLLLHQGKEKNSFNFK